MNPLFNVRVGDGDVLVVTSPKPGAGLRSLELKRSANADLFEFFEEIANGGVQPDDLPEDLDRDDLEVLLKYGVLLPPDQIPEQPLFAAQLSDVDDFTGEFQDQVLIVNPTFRFLQVDLAQMRSWMNERRFSGRPSVWLTNPVTGIELGYWLNREESEIVSQFGAGEALAETIDESLKRRLIGSGILTTREMIKAEEAESERWIAEAQEIYDRNGYAVLRDLVPPLQSAAMKKYYRQYVANGFMPFDDSQSERYYQHNEPLARNFHRNFSKLMSRIVGKELIPSYVYAGSYVAGSTLTPHTDRPQCEFSISMQVDFFPDIDRGRSPWGLFMKRPDSDRPADQRHENYPSESQETDPNRAVYLANGDGVIYKGCDLVHYRYPLADGCKSTSLFLHYVPHDFDGHLD